MIQAFVGARGIPCVHGAIAADGATPASCGDDAFAIDEGGDGAATCEDGRHLPFIATVSARMASIVQQFVETGARSGVHVHPGGMVRI